MTEMPDSEMIWESYDEKRKPINWPVWKKALNIAIVSWLTFIPSVASSMCAPGVPSLMEDFHNSSPTLASLVVSIFVLGYAVGPILFAPLSETFGRVLVYHISNVGFLCFTLLCSKASDVNILISLRFLSGCTGAAPLAIGSGTISDLIRPERRGLVISFYFLGPLLGPSIGPVAGAYVTQSLGWRWNFIVIGIASALATFLGFLFLQETHTATLLRRRAKELRKSRDDSRYNIGVDPSLAVLLANSLNRPLRILFLNPTVLLLSIILATSYGYIFLLLTTFTVVFQDQYNFNTGTVGLTYLGLGLGFVIGVLVNAWLNDRVATRLTIVANGERKPEFRLPLMIWSSFLTPAGLLFYGWTAQLKLHFMLPILGTVLVGAGLILIMMPLQTYLLDAFTTYAASAVAAATMLRCLSGAFLPLTGQPLYNALGLGWGNCVLAVISLVLSPIPWVVRRYGEALRVKFPVA